MRYWLWMVMDWALPRLWEQSLRRGIAAQHYKPNVHAQGAANRTAMSQVEVGDWLLARLRDDRNSFMGYGKVARGFYVADDSLDVPRKDDETGQSVLFPFQERLDVEWFALPFDEEIHGVRCEWPRRQFRVGFQRGRCVAEITKEAFEALKSELDSAGAKRIVPIRREPESVFLAAPTLWDCAESEPRPAPVAQRRVTVRVRDPKNRLRAKERAGWRCEVPGCTIPPILQRETNRGYVEAHHLDPLADEGVEHLSNIAVVCCWHHALLTYGPLDEAERIAEQLKRVRHSEKGKSG